MRVAMSLKQFKVHSSITLVERTKGGVCVDFCPFFKALKLIILEELNVGRNIPAILLTFRVN